MEEWRPVTLKNYSHLYHVSNLGRVKSLRRVNSATYGIMSPSLTTCGYPALALSNKGEVKHVSVHILVARAFIGDPPESLEIDHIDRDKTNNCADNLRYVTRQQNQSNHPKYNGRNAKKCASQYKGVVWYKRNKKWGASISADGKRHHLGLFRNETDAARAFDAAALRYRGEFANLNFPENAKYQPTASNAPGMLN